MASPGTVVVNIIGKADQLKKSLDQADRDLGGFAGKLDDFGKKTMVTGAKFTAGITVPIVAGLGMATKAAADDEAAQAKLAKTLQNTVGATADVVAGVEKQITAFQKVSTFADDDLRPAYENLVRETRNVGEATNLMKTAMDLAAAKGITVEQASEALVKAHNGQTRSLRDLGVETKNAEGTAASFADVMADTNKVVGGQASDALNTTAGKAAAARRDMGELAEKIGTDLLPIMAKIAGWIATVAEKFNNLSPGVQTTILVVVGLAAVIGPLISLIGALSVAFTFLAANPVVLIIAAVAALVAGLILAYQNCETFRNVVNAVFIAVQQIVGDVIGWILQGIARFIGGLADMAGAASKIPGIGDKFKGVAEDLRGVENRLLGAAQKMHGLGESAGNAAADLIYLNGKLQALSRLPNIRLTGPAIPGLAAGGPVRAGSSYIVGEDGPELFTPSSSGSIIPAGSSTGSAAAGTTTVNYSIAVTTLDPAAASSLIIEAIKEFERRNGTGWRAA